MPYTLFFKVAGEWVSAECVSPEQASVLWDVLSQSPDCQALQNRPVRDSAFNDRNRYFLHAKMADARQINNAHTGCAVGGGLDLSSIDMMGCLDAPDYYPTGSTEAFESWSGWLPIATTFNRRWLR